MDYGSWLAIANSDNPRYIKPPIQQIDDDPADDFVLNFDVISHETLLEAKSSI